MTDCADDVVKIFSSVFCFTDPFSDLKELPKHTFSFQVILFF